VAALLAGSIVYQVGSRGLLAYPYLTALAAALAAFLLGAALDRGLGARAAPRGAPLPGGV
jgi:hypothetical protein